MDQLWEFFRSEFTIKNATSQAFWAIALSALVWCIRWIFSERPLSRKKTVAFWVVMPLAIIIVLAVTGFRQADPPRLIGRIDFLTVVEPPKEVSARSGVIVVATVSNRGAPSTAESFQLSVKLPSTGGDVLALQPSSFPEKITAGDLRLGHPRFEFFATDSLYDKTIEHPIPKGGAARGILLFLFPDVRVEDLSQPGTNFTLKFVDVVGGEHTASISMRAVRDKKDNTTTFPGLKSGATTQPPKKASK